MTRNKQLAKARREATIEQRILATVGQKPVYQAEFPFEYQDLFRPFRYKIYYGGRGATKSWSIARALILLAHGRKALRIGCFRELQNSIKDSVHKLLCDQIDLLGLTIWFKITQTSIVHRVTKSEFLFKGLRSNATEIKSTEGIDIAWVEEAQLVSKDSWELLIPTIRKDGSEIWISFNPNEETDATYKKFVLNTPPNSCIHLVNWYNNPWFPKELNAERQHMLATDPEAYTHIWEGGCKIIGDAVVFKGKYVVDTFEYPTDCRPEDKPRLFFGLDFGFAQDPVAATRSYVTGKPPFEELWIEHEAFGVGVEIDEIPQLMNTIPGAREWPWKADNARPESISYIRRQQYQITAAEKWPGCVEDRIAHLKGYKKIHIHQRCKHMQQEARLYSYKVDKQNNDILPVLVDKHNHGWDAVGYSLDGYIQKRGVHQVWGNL